MNKVLRVYNELLSNYGFQGWWPINNAYHPKDYSYPYNNQQKFEICIETILTQNTSWNNVEKALNNLRYTKLLNAKKILSADDKVIAALIKPAGYFNQKTKKIKIFTKFFISQREKTPSRNDLLNL